MHHLTDAQIQAVADGEGPAAVQAHAADCRACGAKVADRQADVAALSALIPEVEMPVTTTRRIDAALTRTGAAGGTRLRPAARPRWRPAAWGTVGLATATVAAVVFVAPMLKKDRGTVSASEILAASADRLAQPVASGVELLEYELTLDGVPREMLAEPANGTYLMRQAIDHDTPGRFRYASYGSGGRPISSIAEAQGRRTMMFTLDGQAYRFEVSVPPDVGLSLPEMERLHLEASIAMMQVSGNQLLEVIDTPAGRHYRIEVPQVTGTVSKVWDLTEARVLIDAGDYRVTEFAVKGVFLRQPYSISYRLVSRTVVAAAPAGTFDVPAQAGEIVLTGEGSAIPAHDVVMLALRELAKVKPSTP